MLDVEVLSGERPLPGARIQIYEREPADLLVPPARWSRWSGGETGADGRRAIPAPPGSYFVTARAPEFAPARAVVVHRPGPGRTSVRLRLESSAELPGSTVEKGTGEPVSLAEIILTPHGFAPDSRGRPDAPEEESLFATSSETGEFQLGGLAPGRYRVEAHAPGYVPAVLPSVPIPLRGRITLELVPGGQLEGVVTRGDGQPASGAEVLASSRKHGATALTDDTGRFFLDVPPGEYAVSAHAGAEAGAMEREVTVAVGQRLQDLSIPLAAGARLSGTVVRKNGSPVLGARVEARLQRSSAVSGLSGTDESGAFSIEPLAAGTYDIQIFMPEGARLDHGPITLAAGGRASLSLTSESEGGSGAFLRGTILGTNGAPVTRFFLDLVSPGSQDSTAHEFMGARFELRGVPPGPSQLLVTVGDGQRALLDLDLRQGENPRLEVPVHPGVPLTGRLIDAATRAPLTEAHVSLPLFGTVRTSDDGRFAFRDLPVGTHHLRVHRASSTTTHTVKLSPGHGRDVGELAIPAP